VNEALRAALDGADQRLTYIAPFRNQAKSIAWGVTREYAGKIRGAVFNESELRVDLANGSRFQLFGADNAQGLRGMHLNGVVLDEFALMDPHVWGEIIRPTLERRQGWAIFIGTPKGRNHFHGLYEFARTEPGWYADYWPASRSGVFDDDQLERLRREQGPDYYAQEYECSWEAAIQGAYYARALETSRREGRIRRVAWEPAIPVSTWWDLGYSDETAIVFAQPVGREWHLIDYYESSGHDLAHYVQVVRSKPYLYGTHSLPHDAAAHTLHAGGKSIAEQAQMLGLKPMQVLGSNDPLDGINQARLAFPRLWFDEDRCHRLIDALASYRAEWDGKRMAFKDKPLHDWAAHGADAFRYFAVSLKDWAGPRHARPAAKARMDFDVFSFQRPSGTKARRDVDVWSR